LVRLIAEGSDWLVPNCGVVEPDLGSVRVAIGMLALMPSPVIALKMSG